MKNIIRRLQDIDKLKLIIFDKRQLKLFENIPKPGIGGEDNKDHLKMKNIIGLKRRSTKHSLKVTVASLDLKDPINKRIMDLVPINVYNNLIPLNESQLIYF